jgi:hypothetical protein
MTTRLVKRVPPLSPETLAQVLAIEQNAREQVRKCHYYDSFNVDAAIQILRTALVSALDLRIKYYTSHPDYNPEWMDQIKVMTFDSLVGNFSELQITASGANTEEQRQAMRIRSELACTVYDYTAGKMGEEGTQTAKATRRDLYNSYLANFPNEQIKILDICWAAGQHYREWKRWINNQWKDGSTADLAFRKILTSGKRPQDYNKKPRPAKWQ